MTNTLKHAFGLVLPSGIMAFQADSAPVDRSKRSVLVQVLLTLETRQYELRISSKFDDRNCSAVSRLKSHFQAHSVLSHSALRGMTNHGTCALEREAARLCLWP
jgi:hypothetical protein